LKVGLALIIYETLKEEEQTNKNKTKGEM